MRNKRPQYLKRIDKLNKNIIYDRRKFNIISRFIRRIMKTLSL